MPRWLTQFSFKRESHWLMVLSVLIPLLGFLLAVVIPRLMR